VQHDQQTIADYGYGDAPSSPLYRYVYASYIDEPVVRKAAGTSGTIHYYHRNQQYSITAMTTSTGAVAERYAYTAYGQPTILNASGTVLTSSAVGNRYTYTGREWDETLGLHHFRARWMSPLAGRFLGRDPIGFEGSQWGLYEALNGLPLIALDSFGLTWTTNDFFNHWWYGRGRPIDLDTDAGLLSRYRALMGNEIDSVFNANSPFLTTSCSSGPGTYASSTSFGITKPISFDVRGKVASSDPLFVLGRSPITYHGTSIVTWTCEKCCSGIVRVTMYSVSTSIQFQLRDAFSNPYRSWESDDQDMVRKQAACIYKAYLEEARGQITIEDYRNKVAKCKLDYPTRDGRIGPLMEGDPYAINARWSEYRNYSQSFPCF
jgi:RHS repeat-associated protein